MMSSPRVTTPPRARLRREHSASGQPAEHSDVRVEVQSSRGQNRRLFFVLFAEHNTWYCMPTHSIRPDALGVDNQPIGLVLQAHEFSNGRGNQQSVRNQMVLEISQDLIGALPVGVLRT